jgi:hypothetical protein
MMPGCLFFFPWVTLLATGAALLGRTDPQFYVPLASDLGILVSAPLMLGKPKQHRVLGALVIFFTALGLAVDWETLANAYSGSYFIIVPAILLGLIVLGGILAIISKPPVSSQQHKPSVA